MGRKGERRRRGGLREELEERGRRKGDKEKERGRARAEGKGMNGYGREWE